MKRTLLILAAGAVALLQSCGGAKVAETYSEMKVVEDGGTATPID